ncbi:unnamed protein product [Caenorhabditis sp. 36 PRJEB53466]|nr:unnamed protein product [Caenorhabditis sp. 36 PRJEB53466]
MEKTRKKRGYVKPDKEFDSDEPSTSDLSVELTKKKKTKNTPIKQKKEQKLRENREREKEEEQKKEREQEEERRRQHEQEMSIIENLTTMTPECTDFNRLFPQVYQHFNTNMNIHIEVHPDGEKTGSNLDLDKVHLFLSKKGLGMMCPEGLTLENLLIKYPTANGKKVNVFDADVGRTKEMSMQKLVNEFLKKSRKRKLNLLSFEFSGNEEMNPVFEVPSCVKAQGMLHILRRYMKEKIDSSKGEMKGKFEKMEKEIRHFDKFLLLSMKGSFTDIHIDFSASAVFYHVFWGKKWFFIAPPTEENLELYQEYELLPPAEKKTWLGSKMSHVFRLLEIEAGGTAFIPAGWLHFVYTVEDSMVFGGNYLRELSVNLHCRLSHLERECAARGLQKKNIQFVEFWKTLFAYSYYIMIPELSADMFSQARSLYTWYIRESKNGNEAQKAIYEQRIEAIRGFYSELSQSPQAEKNDTWTTKAQKRELLDLFEKLPGKLKCVPIKPKTEEPGAAGSVATSAQTKPPTNEKKPEVTDKKKKKKVEWMDEEKKKEEKEAEEAEYKEGEEEKEESESGEECIPDRKEYKKKKKKKNQKYQFNFPSSPSVKTVEPTPKRGTPSDVRSQSYEENRTPPPKISVKNAAVAGTPNMTSIVNRPRESPWRAVSMDEADESIRRIAELFPRETELLSVEELDLGRVLAEEITATENMPATRTSIKDGYAVQSADGMRIRNVVGASSAGSTNLITIRPGECVRISTGGVVPYGADAVIQVEDTEIEKSDGEKELEIRVKSQIKEGQDIRQPGSEVRKGDVLLGVGCILGSAEYGLLNAFGIENVSVYIKPQLTVISSGNELVAPFTKPLPIGMVRDSNCPQLVALFKEHGFKAINGGRMGDEPSEIEEKLKTCTQKTQIIVTSGGVSMGEKDYMKHVLRDRLGMKIEFGRVWMKPGLPCTVASGTIQTKPVVVIALPGNPASAWVCSHLFVLPLLRAVSGLPRFYAPKISVQLATSIKLGPRPEYCRAWLKHEDDVKLPIAHITGNQISSRLLSLVGAQVLLILPSNEKKKSLEENETVFAMVLSPNASV